MTTVEEQEWARRLRASGSLAAGALRAAIAAVKASSAAPAPAQPPRAPLHPSCIEEDCTEDKAIGNERCGAHAAQFERDIERRASSGGDGPETPALAASALSPHERLRGVALLATGGDEIMVSRALLLACLAEVGHVAAPSAMADNVLRYSPPGPVTLTQAQREWLRASVDRAQAQANEHQYVSNALDARTEALASALGAPPGESWSALLGRVRAICDVDPSSLAAFRRDVAELVGRVYEADGMPRTVASHDVILDRIRELVATERDATETVLRREDELSTALGLPTRTHAWSAMLGRVRDALAVEKAPTLHLTAEDRGSIANIFLAARLRYGRENPDRSREHDEEDAAVDTWCAGVEAAFAAVQSHDAIDALAANWGGNGDAVAEQVAAARRVVRVPAKEDPAPAGHAVPAEVHDRGWQWRPTDADTAFAPPFGTIRVCQGCGCLVAGGPAVCAPCAEPAPAAPPPLPEVPDGIRKAPGPWAAYLIALDAALRAREVR